LILFFLFLILEHRVQLKKNAMKNLTIETVNIINNIVLGTLLFAVAGIIIFILAIKISIWWDQNKK